MARPSIVTAQENPRKAGAGRRTPVTDIFLAAGASRAAGAFLAAGASLAAGAFLVAGALLAASASSAQVVLDPSFSPDTIAAGEYAPGQVTDYLIRESYGQRAGDNLFHRFSRFDIPAGQSATFVEDAAGSGIRRVISHIGGNSASRIDGVLRSAIPNADLYLLNPRGVVFGDSARLDLAGAFYASSADNLRFADDVRFGEIESGAAVTLSAADPTAWGFFSAAPAEVAVLGAELDVPEDTALSLVGGSLRIEGPGTSTAPNLEAPSGALHLVAIDSAGEVAVDPTSAPNLDAFTRLGEIRISDGAVLDASGNNNQSLVIAGESLLVDDGLLLARHLGSTNHPGTAVDLQLRGLVRFGDSAADTTGRLISTALREQAAGGGPGPDVGNGGSVRISADEARFDGAGTQVIVGNDCVSTFACSDADQPGGAGGTLEIEADRFGLRNGALIVVQTVGPGTGSSAEIRARRVEIGSDPGESAQSVLLSFNAGRFAVGTNPLEGRDARGGDITVDAEESLTLDNGGAIRSTTWNNGRGGDLLLRAGEFQMVRSDPTALVRRSAITAETEGTASIAAATGLGQAGNVSILSDGDLLVENGFIRSAAVTGAAGGTGEIDLSALNGAIELGARSLVNNQVVDGVGGNITVRAERLALHEGGTLASTLENEGVAGDIRVFADDILVSGINASGGRSIIASRPLSAGDAGAGSSGSVQIEGRRLRVEDGAAISVSTIQFGEVGNLLIGQQSPLLSVTIDNASLEAEASRSTVTGGDIEINADRITLDQGARITTSNIGPGDAGTIRIDGRSLRMRNGSTIETAAGGSGTGGNIHLDLGREVIASESDLKTNTRGATLETQGGNIEIESQVVLLANGVLDATAPVGSGGRIVISGGRFLASPASTVSATGGVAALDGVVQILSAETNAQDAAPRPSVLIQDPTRRLASGCDARTEALGSLFVAPPSVKGPPGEDLHARTDFPSVSQGAAIDPGSSTTEMVLASRCGGSQQ